MGEQLLVQGKAAFLSMSVSDSSWQLVLEGEAGGPGQPLGSLPAPRDGTAPGAALPWTATATPRGSNFGSAIPPCCDFLSLQVSENKTRPRAQSFPRESSSSGVLDSFASLSRSWAAPGATGNPQRSLSTSRATSPSGTCPCLPSCLHSRGDTALGEGAEGLAALRAELVTAREVTPCPAGCTAQLSAAGNSCGAEDSHGFGCKVNPEPIHPPPPSAPSLNCVF